MLEIIGTYEFEWGNKAAYWLVGCIIIFRLYYVQLFLCDGGGLLLHVIKEWYTVQGLLTKGPKGKKKKKTCLHMYILNKHFIKHGMVSCYGQAINHASLRSRVWIVLAPNVYGCKAKINLESDYKAGAELSAAALSSRWSRLRGRTLESKKELL